MDLSISKIKAFKACRRMYQLKYIEKVEPIQSPEALEIGKNYHKMIDDYYKGEEPPEIFTKEVAMFFAFKKYIVPRINIVKTEVKFEKNDVEHCLNFVGIIDGITEDGVLVEHKTTSHDFDEYEYGLQWDEQLLAYMWLTGKRKIIYTLIKKPTIRQKKDETDEEFYQRMLEWYDVDTDSKARLIEIERADEEIKQFEKELFVMCEEMIYAQSKPDKLFFKNTCHCTAYGRRCEYAPICLNYDPNQEYIGFTKREEKR